MIKVGMVGKLEKSGEDLVAELTGDIPAFVLVTEVPCGEMKATTCTWEPELEDFFSVSQSTMHVQLGLNLELAPANRITRF